MDIGLRVFIFVCGVLFIIIVMYFLLKRSISERNSIPFVIGLLCILGLTLYPDILDTISYYIGIDYPPAILFLLSIFYLVIIVLRQSIQISKFNEQIREISQYIALNEIKKNKKK